MSESILGERLREIIASYTDELTPTDYERIVCDILKVELDDADVRDLEVLHNRKYRGKSGHDHQIDVSAEFTLAGVHFLVVVECKFYSDTISVDEVLEFATRIDDISAHKGIVVTTVGFQVGAVKIASSNGIALVKVDPNIPQKLTIQRQSGGKPSTFKTPMGQRQALFFSVDLLQKIDPVLESLFASSEESISNATRKED